MPEDDDKAGNPMIKKLSAKIIMGELKISKKLIEDSGRKELDLFQIAGNATDTKTGESNFGPWIALLGDFQSTNMITGEILRASKVFLPNVVLELVQGKLAGQGSDGRGILFGFVVGIKVDETPNSAKGYVYYARSLIAPAVDDPMSKLLASLPAPKIKPLPAPAEKTEKAAKK